MEQHKNPPPEGDVRFGQALVPVALLGALVLYGLILRPHVFAQPALPLEIIFILASAAAVAHLFFLGYDWPSIQHAIVAKLAQALPAFFILFAIGLIIASWTVCGTIPMLVYYGIKIVAPQALYLLAFLVPVVFSTLTGTSWGSAATVGVVLMGICTALGAHTGITAGAIIGGAYFGDKLSPLSDTTNLAALAAEVDVFDHVQSMMVTTIPSALLAAVAYTVLGAVFPPQGSAGQLASVDQFLAALDAIFDFNPFLLLPPAIVLYGSIRRKPTIPTLVGSVLAAAALALVSQRFTVADVVASLHRGFDTGFVTWAGPFDERITVLLDRGGLYALQEPIVIAFIVFIFIGAIDRIRAMPIVVGTLLRFARTRRSTIVASLFASAVTNALTSNQYATSFLVGEAFQPAYDRAGIPRKVLSRSLEDYGTMIESMVPWTTTAVFMVGTLGVSYAEYAPWQLLSMINFVVAPLLAVLGIGCFYRSAGAEREAPHASNPSA